MTFKSEWEIIKNKWVFPSTILNSKQSMAFLEIIAQHFYNIKLKPLCFFCGSSCFPTNKGLCCVVCGGRPG